MENASEISRIFGMNELLLEKLEATPRWDNPDWCAEHAWLLNKLLGRTQTLVVAHLYARRVIESPCTHDRLIETAKTIFSGDLLDGRDCSWPRHPDDYLTPLHPVMAFGMAHQVLYNRQLPRELKYQVESVRTITTESLEKAIAQQTPERAAELLAEVRQAAARARVEEELWVMPA